jgi:chaperonin GroEL
MPAPKRIVFDQKARAGILLGMRKAATAVGSTLGPRGGLVAISRGDGPKLTKDGVSVIKSLGFSDQTEAIGLEMIREASQRVATQAGDGTTTTALLAHDLCEKVVKLADLGLAPAVIREGIALAGEAIQRKLLEDRRVIKSDDDVRHVALVSANNDAEIASNVIKAFGLIGDDGVVTLGDSLSRKGETTVEYSDGMEVELAASPIYFDRAQSIEFESPKVVVFKKPVTQKEQILPFMQIGNQVGVPIIFIAPDYDDESLRLMSDNYERGAWHGVPLFVGGSSAAAKEDNLSDVAIMLGAGIVGVDGLTLDTWNSDRDFGECERIIVKRGSTIFSEAKHSDAAFEAYTAKLRDDSTSEEKSEYEQEKIKERLARLSGGIATIKVGALTPQAMQEKKDRYEDAICAVRAATADGILIGGGTELAMCSAFVERESEKQPPEKRKVMRAVAATMRRPLELLIASADAYPSVVYDVIRGDGKLGFNADSGTTTDLDELGIYDPYKVASLAVAYACEVASNFSMISCAVVGEHDNFSSEKLEGITEAIDA